MFIISGGRGIGKTKMLLEQAEAVGGTVVCRDSEVMRARAHKYGIVGLNIVSYEEFTSKSEAPIYIHDIDKFLIMKFGDIKGYTQCNE